MSHIFISHSSKDNAFAQSLADHLAGDGFDTWVDIMNLRADDRWPQKLEEAIQSCPALLVIMSRAARSSEWVERETLMAMELEKRLFVVLVEDVPLPLHLVNRQYIDCRQDGQHCPRKVIHALRRANLSVPPRKQPRPLSPEPGRDNFFKYVEQLTDGEASSRIARELYTWAQENADGVTFGSGKQWPGFHVRALTGDDEVTVFSVWAYERQAKVQINFRFLANHRPYTNHRLRFSTLRSICEVVKMPVIAGQADRQPTFALRTLNGSGRLDAFRQIMGEIIDTLRGE
jgi:hypothetical protein